MGLKQRRRGPRARAVALAGCGVLAAVLSGTFTASPAAAVGGAARAGGVSGPGPLAHMPPFQRAFGQQVLADPCGVTAGPGGGVWVADTGHDRVVEFSPSGRLLARVGQGLDQPESITTDAGGHLWVADTGHDRVVEFSPAGRRLATFGGTSSGPGQLDQPAALAVTPSGDFWVADTGHSRVVEFSPAGRYRLSFAVPSPAGLALDARGDVWVSSPSQCRLGEGT
jgi:DNA-binding beta-propeller fold protein YncE